jgi:hypothetical protein
MKVNEAPDSEGHDARAGVLFAVAAVTVTAPRLALAFLAADGVAVPTPWRIDLLAVSSVATAVVLSAPGADRGRGLPTRPRRASTTVLGIEGVAPLGESLFRKSDVLFPTDPGKSVEVPPAGIELAHHDDTHPLAWPQRQRGLRFEQAILVKSLDGSHGFDDDSTATGAT